MEELQDAIEDAQYVNAIASQDDGPRPVLPWDKPTEEQLAKWVVDQLNKNPEAFSLDCLLQSAVAFFLFSSYIKEKHDDYCRINFCEEVLRFKRAQGKRKVDKARLIRDQFLCVDFEEVTDEKTEEERDTTQEDDGVVSEEAPNTSKRRIKLPPRSEIDELDLARVAPCNCGDMELSQDNMDYPENSESCVGLKGSLREQILCGLKEMEEQVAQHPEDPFFYIFSDATGDDYVSEDGTKSRGDQHTTLLPEQRVASIKDLKLRLSGAVTQRQIVADDIFDKGECIVMESLRREYWGKFLESEHYIKLKNFLWYQDRRVVPDDFFVMRVLGRGGFGLVNACKKGTSGKLYAMKVMNKRRIKIKKSEQLALNERQVLAAVESKFVVNLKYSFHSKDDVFLVLDLMTGGDLGYHLHQKGRFPKKECLYYAARIMLGLQALHDKGYVYRDLKPENCLLAEDGRVKITDLGLATRITPTLHGAAGTRGYWAPEMLRRDTKGRRLPYGYSVDWWSFGCCVAEFISGSNPFRSEAALNFGLAKGKQTKEKAVDCATLEMEPEFSQEKFEPDAVDLCRKLLDKNEKTRLGSSGCEEIMVHPWFKSVNWEAILADRKRPPFVPLKDVNAASQSEIGTFAEDKAYQETVITEKDEAIYQDWDWTNPRAFAAEVIEFLIYERETGEPLVPLSQHAGCCCDVL